ncbi:hypothetical protein SDJN03_05240, partial [Cucurbita argyrosperma subsp. sororia]
MGLSYWALKAQVLIVAADNVGSNQLQNIRKGLRGNSIVLMGKNTMMKRSVRIHSEKTGNKAYLSLLPLLVGNVGLIFTKGDLKEVTEEVAKYKVGAPARVGLVAPIDVIIPPGNTGLDPSQTSFFQVPGIRPFSYGLVVLSAYDNGLVFSPEVLDLTEDDLLEKFALGVSMVTSLSLAVSYKNLLAVAVATDYSFPQAEKVKEYLEDPSKFAAAVSVSAVADSISATAAAAAEEKKEEPAEESDDDIGFSLFD